MKGLFLTLLLIPSFLFAQEQPPQSEERTVEIHEFDSRCSSPVHWSASLIAARRNGTLQAEVIERMMIDYENGPLSQYHPETLLYMLEIVQIVYTTESVQTDQEILTVLRTVESLCIVFIEQRANPQPIESPAKETLST